MKESIKECYKNIDEYNEEINKENVINQNNIKFLQGMINQSKKIIYQSEINIIINEQKKDKLEFYYYQVNNKKKRKE